MPLAPRKIFAIFVHAWRKHSQDDPFFPPSVDPSLDEEEFLADSEAAAEFVGSRLVMKGFTKSFIVKKFLRKYEPIGD